MILWWLIDFNRLEVLVGHPAIFAAILGALVAVCAGFILMVRSHASDGKRKGELAYLMPAIIVTSMMMINRKEIMNAADIASAVVYYVIGAIFISGSFNLGWHIVEKGWAEFSKELHNRIVLKAAGWMILTSGITIVCGNFASATVPNPAYITAITLLSPLFIMAVNRYSGIQDKVSIPAVCLMLIGLIALIYFANIPLSPAHA